MQRFSIAFVFGICAFLTFQCFCIGIMFAVNVFAFLQRVSPNGNILSHCSSFALFGHCMFVPGVPGSLCFSCNGVYFERT